MLSQIQYWKRYWEAIRSSNVASLERDVHVERNGGDAMGSLGFCCSRRSLCSRPFGCSRLNLRHSTISATQASLFAETQLARSWLEGRGLLQDNCFGNFLAIHTYFLLLPLGLIAKPFGAPGLLFVLAASVGAAYFWAARILRLLRR